MRKPSQIASKRFLVSVIFVLAAVMMSYGYARYKKEQSHNPYDLQNGDIVFQETASQQGKAIQAATKSRWTHVGMVFFRNGKPMVIEAVQPVRITPLGTFIARNPASFYAMRLKDADSKITPDVLRKAEQYCNAQIGKNYDFRFRW